MQIYIGTKTRYVFKGEDILFQNKTSHISLRFFRTSYKESTFYMLAI